MRVLVRLATDPKNLPWNGCVSWSGWQLTFKAKKTGLIWPFFQAFTLMRDHRSVGRHALNITAYKTNKQTCVDLSRILYCMCLVWGGQTTKDREASIKNLFLGLLKYSRSKVRKQWRGVVTF